MRSDVGSGTPTDPDPAAGRDRRRGYPPGRRGRLAVFHRLDPARAAGRGPGPGAAHQPDRLAGDGADHHRRRRHARRPSPLCRRCRPRDRDCDAYLTEVAERLPQLLGFAVDRRAGAGALLPGLSFSPEQRRRRAVVRGGLASRRRRDRRRLHQRAPGRARPGCRLCCRSAPKGGPRRSCCPGLTSAGSAPGCGSATSPRAARSPSQTATASSSRASPTPGASSAPGSPSPILSLVHADHPGTPSSTSQDGTRRILGYQPPSATGIGLYVSAGISTDAAFGPIYASTWRSVALAAAGALAGCVIAWRLGDRLFRRPIHRILGTIARWRAGDDSARTGISPGDGGEIASSRRRSTSTWTTSSTVRAARRGRRAAPQPGAQRDEPPDQEYPRRGPGGGQPDLQGAGDAGEPEELRQSADGDGGGATTSWSPRTGRASSCATRFSQRSSRSIGGTASPSKGRPCGSRPKAALSLSMAMHELCTNAAKYGALSAPGGSVALRWWNVDAEGDLLRFRLSWTERGGPPVKAPSAPRLRLAADQHGAGQRVRRQLGAELPGGRGPLQPRRRRPPRPGRRADCAAAPGRLRTGTTRGQGRCRTHNFNQGAKPWQRKHSKACSTSSSRTSTTRSARF